MSSERESDMHTGLLLQLTRKSFGSIVDDYRAVLSIIIQNAVKDRTSAEDAVKRKVKELLERNVRMAVRGKVYEPPISWEPRGKRVMRKAPGSERDKKS
ncbi:hypothetical protein HYZ98_05210 [Candidatus Peregrinibacteria bacterium]|nr:hypothetical protein [Candidatus Peregrinibacteria bacterium]